MALEIEENIVFLDWGKVFFGRCNLVGDLEFKDLSKPKSTQ
jgi:hypothetical protein